MTEDMDRKNDFDKGSLTLELPWELHEAFSELAACCRDILETDRPDADFAGVEEKAVAVVSRFGRTFMAKVAGNRDDGARSISRDGRSWYRAKPSGGTFHCLFGKVDYKRSLDRNSTVGKSVCPADESLCLLAGGPTVFTHLFFELFPAFCPVM